MVYGRGNILVVRILAERVLQLGGYPTDIFDVYIIKVDRLPIVVRGYPIPSPSTQYFRAPTPTNKIPSDTVLVSVVEMVQIGIVKIPLR